MRKVILILARIIVGGALLLLMFFMGAAFFYAQRADYGWKPVIAQPSFTTEHPRVVFDEGHNNASKAGFSGRYWPFARLLRADGYSLERANFTFAPESLADVRILVIVNASGAPKPQMFGINLPIPTRLRRGDPAFTEPEVRALHEWVEQGGSLLLIADHAPSGEAAFALGKSLGVTMHNGFVEIPGERSDPMMFSAENGRLGQHPIITGDGPGTMVSRVATFTGQSLDGPPGATVLLRLPEGAVESVPDADDRFTEQPAGPAQGVAFEPGRGRVVVLGEAAMMTAQVSGRVPFGLNTGDNDNQQLVLNIMRWLARKL